MPHYDPAKIKHLIQLSCWTCKVEPGAGGFEALQARMSSKSDQPTLITTKYLQNLWTDATKAAEINKEIGKEQRFILELTSFCDYNSWEDFSEEYDRILGFLTPLTDQLNFKEIRAAILTEESQLIQLRPLISFYGKIIGYTPQLLVQDCKGREVNDLLDDFAYIISFVAPDRVNCIIKTQDNDWSALQKTRRFVPVWDVHPNSYYRVSSFQQCELISGIRGLLLSLIVINSCKDLEPEQIATNSTLSGNVTNNVKNLYGLLSAGNIHISAELVALRDQHIHQYSEKSKVKNE